MAVVILGSVSVWFMFCATCDRECPKFEVFIHKHSSNPSRAPVVILGHKTCVNAPVVHTRTQETSSVAFDNRHHPRGNIVKLFSNHTVSIFDGLSAEPPLDEML